MFLNDISIVFSNSCLEWQKDENYYYYLHYLTNRISNENALMPANEWMHCLFVVWIDFTWNGKWKFHTDFDVFIFGKYTLRYKARHREYKDVNELLFISALFAMYVIWLNKCIITLIWGASQKCHFHSEKQTHDQKNKCIDIEWKTAFKYILLSL